MSGESDAYETCRFFVTSLPRLGPVYSPSTEDESRASDLPRDMMPWQPMPCGDPACTIYDSTVSAITQHMITLQDTDLPVHDIMHVVRELDEHLVLAAYMENLECFTDTAIAPVYAFMRENGASLNVDNAPDATKYLYYLRYWGKNMIDGKIDREVWCGILGQSLPNPGRARKIVITLTKYLRTTDHVGKTGVFNATVAVRDFLVYVIPASILGIYPHCQHRLSMRARMLVYTAFSLCPPSCANLACFVEENKWFVTFAIREYLFYILTHVPSVHDLLCELYKWNDMHRETTDAMDTVRSVFSEKVVSPDFLEDRDMWSEVNEMVYAHNKESVKTCYRAAPEPFYVRMLKEYHAAATKKKKNEATMSASAALRAYTYAAQYDVPEGRILSYALPTVREWNQLDEDAVQRIELASRRYETETHTADTGHALKWLRKHDRTQYDMYYTFLRACQWRLSISFGYLPIEWTEKQVAALQRHYGTPVGLHEDAGVFLYCPQCAQMRSKAVEAPAGQDEKVRLTAYYPDGVSVAVNGTETELVCNAHNIRDHDKRIKHKARNKMNSGLALQERDFQVAVCHNTPLIRVCLIGIVVFTQNSGGMSLCVNCGTAVKWTEAALSTDGPSCGCDRIDPQEVYVTCELCDKQVKRKNTRSHEIIAVNGLREAYFCRRHGTKWVSRLDYPPPFSMVQKNYKNKYRRVLLSDGRLVFVDRDTSKIKRRR